jgi:hypothetical protein
MTALHHTLQQAIKDYKKWSDEYMESLQRRTAINAPLYHYSSKAGLKGILSRQKFWLTDYRHLNDPKELLHGMDLAHAIIAKGIAPMDRAGLFYAMLGDLFSPANFEKVFGFFIASFSRNRDDLAQWHFTRMMLAASQLGLRRIYSKSKIRSGGNQRRIYLRA